MSVHALIGFTALAAVLTVLPGSDFAFTLRWTLRAGRGPALAAAVGIALGCVAWAAASAVGLVSLLHASRLGYDAVRLAGAAYLIVLGVQSLRGGAGPAIEGGAGVVPGGRPRALASGLLNNLLNPKVGVFYLSVLPQFVPAGDAHVGDYLLLGGIHATLGVVWLGTVVWLADRARHVLTRPPLRRRLERLTGVVLIAFGLRVAAEQR
jgi:threonine/homoserine/homoserine lactone efflux protein